MTIKNTALKSLAFILVSLFLGPTAWSHATANVPNPADGAVLSEPPTELSIQFSGPAKLISLTISGSDGDPATIDISNGKSVDARVSVEIPPLPPDSYQVSWRAMGIDGHVTSGDFGFVISVPEQ